MPATINNNGTSRKDLIAQQLEVFRMCNKLIDALKEAAPHGRDYQTETSGQVQFDIDRATKGSQILEVVKIRNAARALGVVYTNQGET